MIRKLRALMSRPDHRLRRAEAHLFDAHGRGGHRHPHDLVVPLDYFARTRVNRILHDWLVDKGTLDLDGLCAEWHAALSTELPPEERLFFKNLVDFLAVVQTGPPRAGAPSPWSIAWRPPRAPHAHDYGRRRG